MTSWTIGKRMVVGFSAVIVVALSLGAFAYSRLVRIDKETKDVTQDSLPGVVTIGQMNALARENLALVVEHILAPGADRKARVEAEIDAVAAKLDSVGQTYEKTIHEEGDRKLFERIASTRAAYRELRDRVVFPLSRQNKTAEAFAAFDTQFKPLISKYFEAVEAAVAYNEKSGAENGHDIEASVTAAQNGIVVGLLAVVGVSGLLALIIVGSTNKALRTSVTELTEGAEQVVSASGQVSTSAQSLSQGATEQAASLEETSASMEEMASMTRQNAENSHAAADLMAQVDTRVRESNQALADMVASMASIQESSQQVAKIIKTIDEIAFQTNILALNAAVEAARAGEAGMGFAVVADEVRNLAQRSAQAAKDTAGLIEASIDKAKSGNQKVEQVAASISGITESVVKVKGLVDEVSAASRQQSQGIDQVSQAIAQMEKVTQTTAATAEESAAASEELNAQAEGSMSVVARLEALVGGKGSKRAAAALAPRANAGRKAASVVLMPAPRRAATAMSAEDQLPMSETGTYGKF